MNPKKLKTFCTPDRLSLRLIRVLFLMVGLSSSQAFGQLMSLVEQSPIECGSLQFIQGMVLATHINSPKLDPALEARVIEQYIKQLDGSKTHFLKSDVEKITAMMAGVFEKIKKRDCSFLTEIQKMFLAKVEARAEFVKNFLGKDYKFDPKTEFIYDPEKADYYKTQEDAETFLKKFVHFQVSNYLSADVKLDEAKKNIIKNYERAIKRVKEMDSEDLYSNFLDSFARSLDPHSSYLSRDFFEDFNIQMSLSLEGIGASLSSEDGFTVIQVLYPGGAAYKSNQVEVQDKIIAVGQAEGSMENVIDMDLKDVVKKIRGPKGSKVRLSLMRMKDGKKQRHEVSLVRSKVNLEEEAAQILYQEKTIDGQKRKVGIINLPSFYSDSRRGGRSCAADLKKLVKEAREKKVEGLVLDFSTNSGGSLEDAVKIAGFFFKEGNVVKQAARADAKDERFYADEDESIEWSGPLVVLVSRASASASEIVAGALQDYRRAVIVGSDHTFGKGSIQQVMEVPPQKRGAVKVTVGMFFLPGGNSTQHRGVESDLIFPSAFSNDEYGEKSLDYSLPPRSIPAFLSPKAYASEGSNAWAQINGDWIKALRVKSQARIDKSEDFKKIIEEASKATKRGKLIKVSEVVKEKGEKDKKAKAARSASKEEKNKEYLKRADVQEATQVLIDLVDIQKSSGKITQQDNK